MKPTEQFHPVHEQDKDFAEKRGYNSAGSMPKMACPDPLGNHPDLHNNTKKLYCQVKKKQKKVVPLSIPKNDWTKPHTSINFITKYHGRRSIICRFNPLIHTRTLSFNLFYLEKQTNMNKSLSSHLKDQHSFPHPKKSLSMTFLPFHFICNHNCPRIYHPFAEEYSLEQYSQVLRCFKQFKPNSRSLS